MNAPQKLKHSVCTAIAPKFGIIAFKANKDPENDFWPYFRPIFRFFVKFGWIRQSQHELCAKFQVNPILFANFFKKTNAKTLAGFYLKTAVNKVNLRSKWMLPDLKFDEKSISCGPKPPFLFVFQ